jgi:hypothetical protein
VTGPLGPAGARRSMPSSQAGLAGGSEKAAAGCPFFVVKITKRKHCIVFLRAMDDRIPMSQSWHVIGAPPLTFGMYLFQAGM